LESFRGRRKATGKTREESISTLKAFEKRARGGGEHKQEERKGQMDIDSSRRSPHIGGSVTIRSEDGSLLFVHEGREWM
jgi:hypothetical protein